MIISEEFTLTQVADLNKKRVVDIAGGFDHCIALTSDGKVNKRLNYHNDNSHSYKLNNCL